MAINGSGPVSFDHFVGEGEQIRRQFEADRFRSLQSTTATSPAIGADFLLTVFSSTRAFAAGFLETILVLFFLLLSGDTLLRRLVEVLPRFGDKRQAIEISQHIEHDISAYLITITIMNAAVGLATALAMWLCGLGDPILWGAVAFLLNYIPILGPMIGVVMFTLAGLLTAKTLWPALTEPAK
jgi:predicted PurR-regulated permease PerM